MSLNSVSKLVLAFVTLIIGAVLIGSIASNGLLVTQKKGINAESRALTASSHNLSINTTAMYTVTNPPTTWKINDCPLTSFALKNQSGTTFTLTDDYTVNLNNGTYYLLNNTVTKAGLINSQNNTYVDYTYCGDDYMNLSWGRTLINVVSGFFAIALLLVSVGLFYSIAKENGIA